MEEKAVQYFKSGYNCAQSVLKAVQEARPAAGAELRTEDFAGCGGGRAENGRCGALHAAQTLFSDSAALQVLEAGFKAEAGSLACREIRKLGRLSCAGCVRTATRLAGQHLPAS